MQNERAHYEMIKHQCTDAAWRTTNFKFFQQFSSPKSSLNLQGIVALCSVAKAMKEPDFIVTVPPFPRIIILGDEHDTTVVCTRCHVVASKGFRQLISRNLGPISPGVTTEISKNINQYYSAHVEKNTNEINALYSVTCKKRGHETNPQEGNACAWVQNFLLLNVAIMLLSNKQVHFQPDVQATDFRTNGRLGLFDHYKCLPQRRSLCCITVIFQRCRSIIFLNFNFKVFKQTRVHRVQTHLVWTTQIDKHRHNRTINSEVGSITTEQLETCTWRRI